APPLSTLFPYTTLFRSRTRMYQVSSSTAAPFGQPETWKTLQIPSGQTVLESGAFDFPEVKAVTRFLVQWIDEADRIIGKTDVFRSEEHTSELQSPCNLV